MRQVGTDCGSRQRDGSAQVAIIFLMISTVVITVIREVRFRLREGLDRASDQGKGGLLGSQSGFMRKAASDPGPGAYWAGNKIPLPRAEGPSSQAKTHFELGSQSQAQPGADEDADTT